MLVIPTLGSQARQHCKFEASLGCLVSLGLASATWLWYTVWSPYRFPSDSYLVISLERILVRYPEHGVNVQNLLHVKVATLKGVSESGSKGPPQNRPLLEEKRGFLCLYFYQIRLDRQ